MRKSLRVSILVGVVLAFFGSLIWWHEVRPYRARRACFASTKEAVKNVSGVNSDEARIFYELCLHARGIEK